MANNDDLIVALDVGSRRIGVAKGWLSLKIAQPATTLTYSDSVVTEITRYCMSNNAAALVIGLPRNLNGDDTAQTESVRSFATELAAKITVPIIFQDEALTSQKAEAELSARHRPFKKEEVDALAATYILEDFFANPVEFSHA